MADDASKPEVLYDHTQRSSARYIIPGVAFVNVSAVTLLAAHFLGLWAGALNLLFAFLFGVAAGMPLAAAATMVLAWSSHIRVDTAHVAWRFGPVGFWHRVPVESLESCRSVKLTSRQLIRDCLRGPLGRQVYWTGRSDAVLLAARAGRYWLGTDQPDAVLNAIRQAVGSRAWMLEPGFLMCRGRPLEAGSFRDGSRAADSAEPTNAANETQDE